MCSFRRTALMNGAVAQISSELRVYLPTHVVYSTKPAITKIISGIFQPSEDQVGNMKRQQLRQLLLLISVIIFPVTLYYHSPVLILRGAIEGLLVGSFLLFAGQFVSGLFLGRAFCGWACAGGGIGEQCIAVNSKKAPGGKSNWIKWFLWVPWIGAIAYAFSRSDGFSGVAATYQTWNGISVHDAQSYIIYFVMVALIAGLGIIFGKRSFCHHACWMAPFMILGQNIGAALRIPRLRLSVNFDLCISCHSCDRACPMSLPVSDMVSRGAIIDNECILCGSCVDTCSTHLIKYSFSGVQQEYKPLAKK